MAASAAVAGLKKKPKFLIEPFKHRVEHDPHYAEKTWKLLEDAMREVFSHNASGLSFEELYRNAYNMVLYKHGDKLYSGVTATVTKHLQGVADALQTQHNIPANPPLDQNSTSVSAAESHSMDAFLADVVKCWTEHTKAMLLINDIFMYMDRTYVKSNNKPVVHEVGLRLWRDVVVRHPTIRASLRATLLTFVHRERVGDVVNRSLLKGVVQMLSDLGPAVYVEELEEPLLHSTLAFYVRESESLLATCDCAEYLRRTEARLREEADRASAYMDAVATVPRVCAVVEREMVGKRLMTLMAMEESGFIAMLQNDRYDDLKRMFELFAKVQGGLDAMKDALNEHVKSTGLALVAAPPPALKEDAAAAGSSPAASATAAPAPVPFVQRLLAEREKYDRLIARSFADDKGFSQVVGQGFESFLNRNPRAPEFMSLYVDELLRKGVHGMAESGAGGGGADAVDADGGMNARLDKVMTLFRYLHEKDLFEKYARAHLAKRLLSGKVYSDDAERVLLGKLKTECGFQYSAKLENMFQDMKTSQDTMLSYRSMLEQQSGWGASSRVQANPVHSGAGAAGPNAAGAAPASAGAAAACASDGSGGLAPPTVEMNVSVLTTGCWPNVSPCTCLLPADLAHSSEHFRQFYLQQHSGRKLAYQTNLGTADLRLTYPAPGAGSDGGQAPKMKHELHVTTYQMIILLLFNERLEYTFDEIQQLTKIPQADLQKNLIALSLIKGKNVLTKRPMSKEVGPSDVFRFNEGFKSKLYRVKIGSIHATKETEPEKLATRARIEEDRKPQIEAAIVRLLKARKRLDINTIVTEVTAQLSARFVPDPQTIKKRLESLLERDFVERDAADRRVFVYVA